MINVIDIGSNTIRLVTYDHGRSVANYGLMSEIIGDTKNGILSDKGTEKLCRAILELKQKSTEKEIYAFGTYAVRILRNKEEVKKRVFEKTGISIDILSGKQEATYDFYGLKETIAPDESGIGVDLGGGSAQLLIFDNGILTASQSRPIGCRQMKNRFTEDKGVTKEEMARIREYIRKNLQAQKGRKVEKIYMMGGTAKAALKLYRFLEGKNVDIIETADIEKIIRFVEETDEAVMRRLFRNRYDNIVVGIVIMREIAEFFGAARIHIKKCGVRDGYVSKISKKINMGASQ